MHKRGHMYITDNHVHLENGPLSKEYVEEFISQAVKMGVSELHILDHTHRFKEFYHCYDKLREVEIQDKWLSGKFKSSLLEYDELIKELRKETYPIEVKFGLEVCYTPESEGLLKEILPSLNYDFLIGSIHSVDGLLYDMGFSKEILWEKYDTNIIYQHYYEAVKSLIKSDLFDSIGHIDNLKLFGYYPSIDMTQTYLEVAKLLKEHNVLLEVNSGCKYRYGCDDLGISDELLRIFKTSGVKFITGSDAHKVSDVGKLLKETSERIKSFV